MDKIYFPDDWIAPGEFCFCHRGEHLVLMPRYYITNGKLVPNPSYKECCAIYTTKKITFIDKVKNLIYNLMPYIIGKHLVQQTKSLEKIREEIAQLRKDAGILPLFWLTDSEREKVVRLQKSTQDVFNSKR